MKKFIFAIVLLFSPTSYSYADPVSDLAEKAILELSSRNDIVMVIFEAKNEVNSVLIDIKSAMRTRDQTAILHPYWIIGFPGEAINRKTNCGVILGQWYAGGIPYRDRWEKIMDQAIPQKAKSAAFFYTQGGEFRLSEEDRGQIKKLKDLCLAGSKLSMSNFNTVSSGIAQNRPQTFSSGQPSTPTQSKPVQPTPRDLAAKQLAGDTLVGNACNRKLEIEVNIADVFLNNPNQPMDPLFLIRGSVKANPSSNQATVAPLIGAIHRSDGIINLTTPSGASSPLARPLLISLFRDTNGEGWEGMMEGMVIDGCDDVRLISKNGNKTTAFPVMTGGLALKMSNPKLAPKSAMYRPYWLQIAEARGAIDATYYLGEEYEQRGKSSPQNYVRALQYYQDAAKKNDDARAQYALGRMYEEGLGTQASIKIAEKWKHLAKTTEEAAARACASPKVRNAVEHYMRQDKSSAQNMRLLTEVVTGIDVDVGEIAIRKIAAKDVISINKPFLCEIGGERVNVSVEKEEPDFVIATDQFGRAYYYDNSVSQVTSAGASAMVAHMYRDMPYSYTFRLKPMGNGRYTLEYGADSEILDLGHTERPMFEESETKTTTQAKKPENEKKDLVQAAEKSKNIPQESPDNQETSDQNKEPHADGIPNIEGWARDFFKK